MPYDNSTGFIPRDFQTIVQSLIAGINQHFGTTYTYNTFTGTNMYRYFYPLIQELMKAENEFSNVFTKLQEFIIKSNEKIMLPKTPKIGLMKILADNGFQVCIRDNTVQQAGRLGLCVNLDPDDPTFDAKKTQICNLLNEYTVAGLFYDGDQTGAVVLPNGQSFDYSFSLPTFIPIKLRLDVTISKNTMYPVTDPGDVKNILKANISELYTLGVDFEPEKYLSISRDVPYASAVYLEYSLNAGQTWHDDIYEAQYTDYMTFADADIAISQHN